MNRGELILVVDDEPDVSALLDFHLRRHGYRTLLAADGRAALNMAFEERPALILLDLMLPLLHGREVCRLLRSSPLTSHIPIIMLSAMASTDDKLAGFTVGADDYVTKPFEVAEVLARVAALLARVRVAQEAQPVVAWIDQSGTRER